MPAIVKANSTVLAGGLALVRYETSQGADLSLAIDSEFVALSSANVEPQFRLGATPPPQLRDLTQFIGLLNTYGARGLPKLSRCTIVATGGLKTITANYVVTIAATNIISEEDVVTVDPSNPTGVGGDSNGTGGGVTTTPTDPGDNYTEVSTSTDWKSISGSVSKDDVSYSFSADYLSTTVTIVSHGNGGAVNVPFSTLGALVNKRGEWSYARALQRERSSSRSYRNSRGQTRNETTITSFYIIA